MGPYLGTRVPIGTFLAFWVPIGFPFTFQGPYFQCFGFIHAKNVNSVCLHVYSSELTWFVCDNFLHCYYTYMLWSDASHVTLLANFDFFLCLRVKFHKLLFWVPIFAAGSPYWIPISQKVGSLFLSLGVPISLGDSVAGEINWQALELNRFNTSPEIKLLCKKHGLDEYIYKSGLVQL